MQKYQYLYRRVITGIGALFGCLLPFLISAADPSSHKIMEHELGEHIDQLESIIPVMERNKAIDIALPYFNRFPHFTEHLIGQAVQYFPLIEQVLKKHHLPDDLKYIPFFESGFRKDVVSPAGAQGLWQFMEDTGRKYGLTINNEIDERLDYVKSTEAAARFLKSLHEDLGSWALVLMAYNGGPYRVKRLVRESNTSNPQVIMDKMPKESQTYLSKMIAAKLIFKTYKQYGLQPRIPDPVHFYTLNTSYISSIDLNTISKEYNVDYSVLRQANPHLKYRKIRNANQNIINVHIPRYATKGKEVIEFRKQFYYISSEEQLEQLASFLGISKRKLEMANGFFDPGRSIGHTIAVQVTSSEYMTLDKAFGPPPARFLKKDLNLLMEENLISKALSPGSGITPAFIARELYYLKPSESLIDVAMRLNISLKKIKEMNPDMNLYQSNRVYIPVNESSPGIDVANVR